MLRNRLLNLYSYPFDIIKLAKDTQNQVRNAIRVLNISDIGSMQEMINVLDEISDKMCVVTDSSECIRRLHPDAKWRLSADKAFNSTCTLMNELNSDKKLINQFIEAEKGHVKGHDHELDAVVQQFRRDFELFYRLNERERVELCKLQNLVEESALEFERKQSISSLEKMIKLRFELAIALGFKNPSEMSLRDKQIRSSVDVMRFLDSKWKELQSNLSLERKRLRVTNIKRIIEALMRLSKDLFKVHVEVKSSCLNGLAGSFAFEIYENSEFFGEIIFDLKGRRFKDPHPTHYTIQCRKQGSPALILISLSIDDLEEISWNQSQSLFHEYGHALHSVLSRTRYQMLSGTRGAIDLAEIPSSLFELIHDNFDLQKYLNTGTDKFLSVPAERILKEEAFQLQISAMDQLLHSTVPGSTNYTRDLAHEVELKFNNRPHRPNIDWYCNVQHFATYGGGYFAYIFSKSFAERIWKTFPQGSDLFKREFLEKGGTAKLDLFY